MHVILPPTGNRLPIGNRLPNTDREADPYGSHGGTLLSQLQLLRSNGGRTSGCTKLERKEPFFDGVKYRLDFGGRASIASVKNFQLVDPTVRVLVICGLKIAHNRFHAANVDGVSFFWRFMFLVGQIGRDLVLCQLGKVSENRYNLDFKGPLNPLQVCFR